MQNDNNQYSQPPQQPPPQYPQQQPPQYQEPQYPQQQPPQYQEPQYLQQPPQQQMPQNPQQQYQQPPQPPQYQEPQYPQQPPQNPQFQQPPQQPYQGYNTAQQYPQQMPAHQYHTGKSSKTVPVVIAIVLVVLLVGGMFGGHFLGFYTLPFMPERTEENGEKSGSGDISTPASPIPGDVSVPASPIPVDPPPLNQPPPPASGYTRGTLTATGYFSEFLNLSINVSDRYIMVSLSELEELSDQSAVVEFFVSDIDSTYNMIITVDFLTAGFTSVADYLESLQQPGLTRIEGYDINDTITIAGNEFYVIDFEADSYYQSYCARKVGDYMLVIILTSSKDDRAFDAAINLLFSLQYY